jgi:pimeloyl-ACP methyl ester carboxylesterase
MNPVSENPRARATATTASKIWRAIWTAVLALTGDKPAILLGHSIGGMITLTFCRLFPNALGTRVNGLVLTHTTPTNPIRTTSGAGFFTAIEKPVLVPMLYLTIALSPLFGS